MKLQTFFLCLSLLAMSYLPEANNTIAQAEQVEQAESETFEILDKEAIGPYKLGQLSNKLPKQTRCQLSKDKEQYWGADGEYHQHWTYKGCGLMLGMVASQPKGAQRVFSVTITAPSKYKTARGIGIGSPEAAVRKAYAAVLNLPESKPGETLVAGSIYGGLIFYFKNGKVSEIFMGAAAE